MTIAHFNCKSKFKCLYDVICVSTDGRDSN